MKFYMYALLGMTVEWSDDDGATERSKRGHANLLGSGPPNHRQ